MVSVTDNLQSFKRLCYGALVDKPGKDGSCFSFVFFFVLCIRPSHGCCAREGHTSIDTDVINLAFSTKKVGVPLATTEFEGLEVWGKCEIQVPRSSHTCSSLLHICGYFPQPKPLPLAEEICFDNDEIL